MRGQFLSCQRALSPILKVYPWHGAAAPLPPDALFVAAYNVFVGIDSFAEGGLSDPRRQG
jgi:hypothetical protein